MTRTTPSSRAGLLDRVSWKQVTTALVVGSNLARRCRSSRIACASGAARRQISFVNPQRYEYLFPVANYLASNGLGTFGQSGRRRGGC